MKAVKETAQAAKRQPRQIQMASCGSSEHSDALWVDEQIRSVGAGPLDGKLNIVDHTWPCRLLTQPIFASHSGKALFHHGKTKVLELTLVTPNPTTSVDDDYDGTGGLGIDIRWSK